MNTTLHLTADERAAFALYPDDLREGWQVEEELLSSFETDDELSMRYSMSSFAKNPSMKSVADALTAGDALDPSVLDTIQPDMLPSFYFTIGARGVTMLMHAFLGSLRNDADVQGLAALSTVRHALLETNASPR